MIHYSQGIFYYRTESGELIKFEDQGAVRMKIWAAGFPEKPGNYLIPKRWRVEVVDNCWDDCQGCCDGCPKLARLVPLEKEEVTEKEIWIQKDREWSDYPVGTKARAIGGGYWVRNKHGWKWFIGSTFPRPGGDASGMVCLPEVMEQGEEDQEGPIRLRHMSLTEPQWRIIFNYTRHNNSVVADTIIDDSVGADFAHSKETNEKLARQNAVDLTIRLLRKGISVLFKDGEKSERIIASVSPPLYDKFYRKQNP